MRTFAQSHTFFGSAVFGGTNKNEAGRHNTRRLWAASWGTSADSGLDPAFKLQRGMVPHRQKRGMVAHRQKRGMVAHGQCSL